MMGLGVTELIVILILIIFFVGGKRLPKIGEGLGRGIMEFKKNIRGDHKEASGSKKLIDRDKE